MIVKSSIQVTAITVLNLVINFLVQLVVAFYFGAKLERDAYFLAIAIPTYISTVFAGSFGVVFLPKLIKIYVDKSDKEFEFINLILNNSFYFLLLVSIVGIFFSESIIGFIAPGFSDEGIQIASTSLRILFPTVIFQGLSGILASVYQS